MPETSVFISYAADDASWTSAFAESLQRAGIATFLRERDVAAGQVTLHRIEAALGASEAAVVVLSAAAFADPTAQDEYAALIGEGTRRGLWLIPVLHGAASIRVPPLLGTRLWADFRGLGPAERHAKADSLAEVLRDPVHRNASPPVGPQRMPALEVLDAVRSTPGRVESPSPGFVVTYAASDAAFGERLVRWLHGAGQPVWSIADLRWGSRYVHEIRQHIRHAYALLVVMSPAAEESEDVEREILEGLRQGREFFPVLLDGDRNFLLGSSWCFDARGGVLPGEAELRRLQRIRHALVSGQPVQRPRSAPAGTPTVPGGAPTGPVGTPLLRLRRLLAEGDLAHADMWTTALLLAAAGRLDTGWLQPGDSGRLPLSLLTGVDAAWSAATGGCHGFRSQLDLYRVTSDRGIDLLDAADAYGWRQGTTRATPRYERFVDRATVPAELPVGFFPTLRNPQVEAYPAWYDRWHSTVLAVHLRLRDWEKENSR